jgi:hypothetical protein
MAHDPSAAPDHDTDQVGLGAPAISNLVLFGVDEAVSAGATSAHFSLDKLIGQALVGSRPTLSPSVMERYGHVSPPTLGLRTNWG